MPREKQAGDEPRRRQRRRDWAVAAALALVTLAVYSRTFWNGFVNFDDTIYVTDNRHVQTGLTLESVRWACASMEHANWHPLTWLSLEFDATLYGLNPAGFHATSVLLHVANTVLLFWILRSATGAAAPSGLAAALFAIHPLHVESVAWAAERKDVLSGLFWLLTLAAYGRYAARPSFARYAGVAALFALGLAAKPMLVTLPCVLLLCDFWPLGRHLPASRERGESCLRAKAASVKWLFWEKAPLLLLSAASSAITIVAQRRTGAIQSAESLSVGDRLIHVPLAYVEYLAKTIWPRNLAIYYPFTPHRRSLALAALAAALLAMVSLWIFRRRERQPYLAVGWLWFLGTLTPVIGLVQVGGQALADRYTYLPLIGVFIAFAWWADDQIIRRRLPRRLVAIAALAGLSLLATGAWVQIGYWRDSVTLWRHALRVVGADRQVLDGLGGALLDDGRPAEAVPYLQAAIRMGAAPDPAYVNLGVALFQLGRYRESQGQFEAAIKSNGRRDKAAYNLGCVRLVQGDASGAIDCFEQALRSNPFHWQAHLALAETLAVRGAAAEAERHFRQALEIDRQESLRVWRHAHPDAADAAALAEQAAHGK